MRLGVLRETAPLERRVALVPPSVQKLHAAGHSVLMETGAGDGAYFPDAAYVAAGAELRGRGAVLVESEVLLAVQRPPLADLDSLPAGSAVLALLPPPRGHGGFRSSPWSWCPGSPGLRRWTCSRPRPPWPATRPSCSGRATSRACSRCSPPRRAPFRPAGSWCSAPASRASRRSPPRGEIRRASCRERGEI